MAVLLLEDNFPILTVMDDRDVLVSDYLLNLIKVAGVFGVLTL